MRWEYVDRSQMDFHHLWTMNPDGTGQMVFFGNMHPGGVFIDAKPIPGSERVVLIHSPGHGSNEHAGCVATVSVKQGPDARPAMRNLSKTADFRDPCALAENAILVARGNQLLLMNSQGAAEILYTAAGAELHEPAPILRQPRERLAPPRADPASPAGVLILSDVYTGRNMTGVQRGSIRKLLVLEDLPKPANFHGGGSQPIGHGVTSTLKRILGTVPVEPDGSAHFEAPPMRSLYFAALDAGDRSIKQMRSFVTLQPGETAGCVGCHDTRTQAPRNGPTGPLAMSRPASRIEPIDDVPPVMDFPRDVQPILDRRCASCHNPARPDGGAVLSADRGPVYSLSFYDLLLYWQVKDTAGPPAHGSGRQLGNDGPYAAYSSASPLMRKLDGSHYEARLSPQELKTVRLWIDSGAAYAGTYAAYGTGQVGGCWGNNEPVRVMADDWPTTPPARDAVRQRCGSCHGRMLPEHVTDRIPLDPWGDMLSWERPLSRYSRHRVFNLSRPDRSLMLRAPLARGAGGLAEGPLPPESERKPIVEDRSRPPRPAVHPIVFADPADPDFRRILAHLEAAKQKLDEIKRFDMPGFKPNEHYVREMKRFGVLPASFDPARDPIDAYATDEAYWRSFWHRPSAK
jgi:cytochrome c553